MQRQQTKLDTFLQELRYAIGEILAVSEKGDKHTQRKSATITISHGHHHFSRRPNNDNDLESCQQRFRKFLPDREFSIFHIYIDEIRIEIAPRRLALGFPSKELDCCAGADAFNHMGVFNGFGVNGFFLCTPQMGIEQYS